MSFVRLFWLRLTTRSSQEKLKMHSSSSILQWMSYSVYSTAGADRLAQIHVAWFDYRRTIRIKIEALRQKRENLYLTAWFKLKRKRNKKFVRRLVRWAKK
jgi:hypothetical protein